RPLRRKPPLSAFRPARSSPVEGLRLSGAWDRGAWAVGAVWLAGAWQSVRRQRQPRVSEHAASRTAGDHLSAPANSADGSHASGHSETHRKHAFRRVVAWFLLWRAHLRRRHRVPLKRRGAGGEKGIV